MALGALIFYNRCAGRENSWSWKKEAIAFATDAITVIALGILVALVATGILKTHFPVGPSLVHNPILWSLIGVAAAIISWDIVLLIIKKCSNYQEPPEPPGGTLVPTETNGNWLNFVEQKNRETSQVSILNVPIEVFAPKIFNAISLQDQIALASSCKHFAQMADASTLWYKQAYLPSRTLLQTIYKDPGAGSLFKKWVTICSVAKPRYVHVSNGGVVHSKYAIWADDIFPWDLNALLSTCWPQGEVCICGNAVNFYFCSIGLNFQFKNEQTWEMLTACVWYKEKYDKPDSVALYISNYKHVLEFSPKLSASLLKDISLHTLVEETLEECFTKVGKTLNYTSFEIAPPPANLAKLIIFDMGKDINAQISKIEFIGPWQECMPPRGKCEITLTNGQKAKAGIDGVDAYVLIQAVEDNKCVDQDGYDVTLDDFSGCDPTEWGGRTVQQTLAKIIKYRLHER